MHINHVRRTRENWTSNVVLLSHTRVWIILSNEIAKLCFSYVMTLKEYKILWAQHLSVFSTHWKAMVRKIQDFKCSTSSQSNFFTKMKSNNKATAKVKFLSGLFAKQANQYTRVDSSAWLIKS